MVYDYQEILPPYQFAFGIECFWSMEVFSGHEQIIHPDGCTDVLFRSTGSERRLDIIGTMTRPQTVHVLESGIFFGVRFNPGMAGSILPGYSEAKRDTEIPFDLVLPRKSQKLLRDICNSDSIGEKIDLLQNVLLADVEPSPVQVALTRLRQSKGRSSIEELCDIAHLGERQFRRDCKRLTGISPKMLSRIVRFRSTKAKLASHGSIDLAQLALENGYFDQAHMVHEFNDFAGCSPLKMKNVVA